MNKYLTTGFLILSVIALGFSQTKEDILLTIDGDPIYVKEFARVYKKNLELVQDESQKDVEGYLDLFVNYKLKVREAKAQKLAENKSDISELAKYEEQLYRSYIAEDKVIEDLAEEAYARSLEEIKARHILVLSSYDDSPQDTLKAYRKIENIRKEALKGNFESLAKLKSEEPGAKKSGGNLGYFTAFGMVYPFESMAYNTKVGEVSEIVRTRFGYHIIKVEDRRKRFKPITVSHIMINLSQNAERTFDPKERIDELYAMVKQGEDFGKLAKKHSDDKVSGRRDGKLNKFSKGDLRSEEFETAAYELKNIGDISEPVKSQFGWHIIKLEGTHEFEPYKLRRESLIKKITKGDRSKVVSNDSKMKLKKKYGFEVGAPFMDFFKTMISRDSLVAGRWKYVPIDPSQDKLIFTVGKNKVYFSDFSKYIEKSQKRTGTKADLTDILQNYYNNFEASTIKDYFKSQIKIENEEYGYTLNEYREGLLVYSVMNKNVWKEVRRDTLGLKEYFENNITNYQWKNRVEAIIISSPNESITKQAAKLLAEGISSEEIKKQLNTEGKVNVIVSEGVYEIGSRELPNDFNAKVGISEVYNDNDSFIVVKVNKMIPSGRKELDDVRGHVITDYQNFVEMEWLKELRKKYEVKVDENVLEQVKKQLGS